MTTLREIARALGGEISGASVIAPGPNHSKSDRSLSVRLSPDSPDGYICHSFAGDPWQEYRDYVRQRLGLPAPEFNREPRRIDRNDDAERDAWLRARAVETFFEGRDPRETPVETYLSRDRGLSGVLDDVLVRTLRYHPRCAFKTETGLEHAPALVCAFRNVRGVLNAIVRHISDGDSFEEAEASVLADSKYITSIHRTRITPDGRKVSRAMLGRTPAGAGIFLCAPSEIISELTLTVGEGVETMLSTRRRGFSGCVALGSAGAIERLEPLGRIRRLTISAENNATSRRATAAAVETWTAAGKAVGVVRPLRGDDLNDIDRGAA